MEVVDAVPEKKFTQLVSEIDQCYSEKSRKDISVAFCFICVLHLANENNLKIHGDPSMKELIISS
jgi:condensin complex subunit 2